MTSVIPTSRTQQGLVMDREKEGMLNPAASSHTDAQTFGWV